ncbi:tRNA pseudouridine(55) synthase TruB [Patescibacteria group bacterium]|nr:tRNA pseudouridine(55) synthase TruB [Patescibacteria group bacterium]
MISNIYKPTNLTSFDCIRILKKQYYQAGKKPPKIGHAGTLDPFADGALIICTEKDTKKISEIQHQPKEYLTTIKLGYTSDTYDVDGHIVETQNLASLSPPTKSNIKKILENNFLGEILQTPPIFSAKKVGGQRSYSLARKGLSVKLSPKKVLIYNIGVNSYRYPYLKLTIKCSTGTYIRSIAHDLGQILNTGAYCHQLTRTKVGEYSIDDSTKLADNLVKDYQNRYLKKLPVYK